MFLMSNRAINENNKMKNSILKSLIDHIKHHRAINENDVIRFKCSSKIMIFKNDIFIISAFLSFCYDKHICWKMILLFIIQILRCYNEDVLY